MRGGKTDARIVFLRKFEFRKVGGRKNFMHVQISCTRVKTIWLSFCSIILYAATQNPISCMRALICKIMHAFRSKGVSRFWWETGIGVLYFCIALMLLINPMQGAITITLLLTILFLIEGTFKIVLALQLWSTSTSLWMLFSGLISVALGIMILSDISGSASWILGLMVGINFVFAGWALIRQASYFKAHK